MRLPSPLSPVALASLTALASFTALASLTALASGCSEDPAPAASNPGGVGPGGSVDSLPDVAGCSASAAVAGTEIGVAADSFKYTPACLEVKVGTVVSFKGGGALHPLAPMTKGTTANNPIPRTQESEVSVTFSAPGVFPYFCENHGSDGGTTNMVGAVYVVP